MILDNRHYVAWGKVYTRPQQALEDFNGILQRDPHDAGALCGTAMLDVLNGSIDKARATLRKLMPEDVAHPLFHVVTAHIFIREELYDTAAYHCDQATGAGPGWYTPHAVWATALMRATTHDYPAVPPLVQKVHDAAMKNQYTLMLLGDAYYKLGRVTLALEAYEEASTYDVRSPEIGTRILAIHSSGLVPGIVMLGEHSEGDQEPQYTDYEKDQGGATDTR